MAIGYTDEEFDALPDSPIGLTDAEFDALPDDSIGLTDEEFDALPDAPETPANTPIPIAPTPAVGPSPTPAPAPYAPPPGLNIIPGTPPGAIALPGAEVSQPMGPPAPVPGIPFTPPPPGPPIMPGAMGVEGTIPPPVQALEGSSPDLAFTPPPLMAGIEGAAAGILGNVPFAGHGYQRLMPSPVKTATGPVQMPNLAMAGDVGGSFLRGIPEAMVGGLVAGPLGVAAATGAGQTGELAFNEMLRDQAAGEEPAGLLGDVAQGSGIVARGSGDSMGQRTARLGSILLGAAGGGIGAKAGAAASKAILEGTKKEIAKALTADTAAALVDAAIQTELGGLGEGRQPGIKDFAAPALIGSIAGGLGNASEGVTRFRAGSPLAQAAQARLKGRAEAAANEPTQGALPAPPRRLGLPAPAASEPRPDNTITVRPEDSTGVVPLRLDAPPAQLPPVAANLSPDAGKMVNAQAAGPGEAPPPPADAPIPPAPAQSAPEAPATPPPAPAPEAGKAKEPWEMTKAEVRKKPEGEDDYLDYEEAELPEDPFIVPAGKAKLPKGDYFYHYTPFRNLSGIKAEGLTPYGHESGRTYTESGYIFAAEKGDPNYFDNAIARDVFNEDASKTWGVLRFKKGEGDWEADPQFDEDDPGSFRSSDGVDPGSIEILTENGWKALGTVATDMAGYTQHELDIRAALASGKPVPPAVLADYPDLAAKYPAQAARPPAAAPPLPPTPPVEEAGAGNVFTQRQESVSSKPPSHVLIGQGGLFKPKPGDIPTATDLATEGAKAQELVNDTEDMFKGATGESEPETVSEDFGVDGSELVPKFPVASIQSDPDRFQFKGGTDKGGVDPNERLQGKYNQKIGKEPLLVWQDKAGSTFVVNGHHRLDLAQRTGTQSVPVEIIREADGFSDMDARVLGAEINIRQKTGKVSDYARYFREAGISRADAVEKGLLGGAKGRSGWALGQLAGEDLYAQYTNGGITEQRAVAIAEAAPGNAALQLAGINFATGKAKPSPEQISAFIKALSSGSGRKSKPATGEQGDLFGLDDSAIKEATQLAEAVSKIQRELKDLIAGGASAKKVEAAQKRGLPITKEMADAMREEDASLQAEIDAWDKWETNPALVDRARKEAGLDALDPNRKAYTVTEESDEPKPVVKKVFSAPPQKPPAPPKAPPAASAPGPDPERLPDSGKTMGEPEPKPEPKPEPGPNAAEPEGVNFTRPEADKAEAEDTADRMHKSQGLPRVSAFEREAQEEVVQEARDQGLHAHQTAIVNALRASSDPMAASKMGRVHQAGMWMAAEANDAKLKDLAAKLEANPKDDATFAEFEKAILDQETLAEGLRAAGTDPARDMAFRNHFMRFVETNESAALIRAGQVKARAAQDNPAADGGKLTPAEADTVREKVKMNRERAAEAERTATEAGREEAEADFEAEVKDGPPPDDDAPPETPGEPAPKPPPKPKGGAPKAKTGFVEITPEEAAAGWTRDAQGRRIDPEGKDSTQRVADLFKQGCKPPGAA